MCTTKPPREEEQQDSDYFVAHMSINWVLVEGYIGVTGPELTYTRHDDPDTLHRHGTAGGISLSNFVSLVEYRYEGTHRARDRRHGRRMSRNDFFEGVRRL